MSAGFRHDVLLKISVEHVVVSSLNVMDFLVGSGADNLNQSLLVSSSSFEKLLGASFSISIQNCKPLHGLSKTASIERRIVHQQGNGDFFEVSTEL